MEAAAFHFDQRSRRHDHIIKQNEPLRWAAAQTPALPWMVAETNFSRSLRGMPTKMTMGWACVKATWHRIIRLRKSEDIYIQRQLSPQLGKRGGQLSSSTSIHYVSIKKSNGNRRTHWLRNCHTGKPRSGSEVHLLLDNQETTWDSFNQITVWQIQLTGAFVPVSLQKI